MTIVDVVCYKYKPLKNGELPLMIRICKDRKRRYINLGVSTKTQDWDFLKNQPKSTCPNKEYIEKLISSKISEIRDKIIELKAENKEYSATTLKEKVSVKTKLTSIGDVFIQHLVELEQENRTGYRLSIKQTYNSLIKYNKHLDMPFSEMDYTWLKRYEAWLRKQGKSENTIGIRFRNIRVIFNLALNMKLLKIDDYPFKQLKVSKMCQETAKRAIHKEDVQAIINYSTTDKDFYTKLAVSLFSFSYFMGGINFVDMAYLTHKNILDNRLVYRRKKTSKLISLPIGDNAIKVLKCYNLGGGYIFPILSTSHKTEQMKLNRLHKVITKVNRALRLIGEELDLPIKLTTYTARHSYATSVCLANGVSIENVAKMLGHSNIKMTQHYAKVLDKSILKDMMNVKNIIANIV